MIEDALPRNRANHVPLSPVAFPRACSALIYPSKVAVRHGRLALHLRRARIAVPRLASALAARGVAHGDTVAVMAPNVPALLEAHYAVPALGAVLNPLNVRLDGRARSLLPRSRGRQGAIDRRRVRAGREIGAGATRRSAARRRSRRSRRASGRAPGRASLRGTARRRRCELRVAGSARRMGFARAPLHVGHDRRSEGCGLSPSRRVPQRPRQRARLQSWQPDSVYLWTLPMFHCCGWTLHLGRYRCRGHARLPAARRPGVDLRGDPRPSRDAPMRRADRAQPARSCAGRGEADVRARRRRRHRRCRASVGGDRGNGSRWAFASRTCTV